MSWSHLPVEGGLYDQHPLLLEQWRYIFREKARAEEERRKQETRRNSAASNSPRSTSRSPRRR